MKEIQAEEIDLNCSGRLWIDTINNISISGLYTSLDFESYVVYFNNKVVYESLDDNIEIKNERCFSDDELSLVNNAINSIGGKEYILNEIKKGYIFHVENNDENFYDEIIKLKAEKYKVELN